MLAVYAVYSTLTGAKESEPSQKKAFQDMHVLKKIAFSVE
jgi:hypothetical protein